MITSFVSKKVDMLPKKVSIAIIILSLIAAVFAVYANIIGGPFLFDDIALVENNPLIRSVSNIPHFFKADIFANRIGSIPISNSYRPLQTITYAIDFFLWGDSPSGFHLTNICIHIINVLLVFFLIKRFSNGVFLPYFVSLLFGIHPVNTQSVSYIAGRADLLVALFMLLSIIFYIDYSKCERKHLLSLSVVSFLLAIYCKEIAIFVVPGILFVYNATFNRKAILKVNSYLYHLLSLLVYFPMRAQALKAIAPRVLELSKLNMFSRVFTSLKTLFVDFRILLLPYDLHFGRTAEVERSISGSLSAIFTLIGCFFIAVLLFLVYRRWKTHKDQKSGFIFFGILWFFVSMLPLLNIAPLQVFHSDNWLYFSSIGLYLVGVVTVGYILQLINARKPLFKKVSSLLLCLVLLLYGHATVDRNRDYRDEIRFYLSNVKWRPNVKFYRIIGGLYGQRGDYDKAVNYLNKAIETNKTYPAPNELAGAYYNLGVTYMELSKYQKAEEAFKNAMPLGDKNLKKETKRHLLYLKNRIE